MAVWIAVFEASCLWCALHQTLQRLNGRTDVVSIEALFDPFVKACFDARDLVGCGFAGFCQDQFDRPSIVWVGGAGDEPFIFHALYKAGGMVRLTNQKMAELPDR